MSGDRYMDSDFYNDSAYTADISTKMRIPEHLMAHGVHNGDSGSVNHDLDLDKTNLHLYDMQVPDRLEQINPQWDTVLYFVLSGSLLLDQTATYLPSPPQESCN